MLSPRQNREPEGEQSAVSLKSCSKGKAQIRPLTLSPQRPSLYVNKVVLNLMIFLDKSKNSGQEVVHLLKAMVRNRSGINCIDCHCHCHSTALTLCEQTMLLLVYTHVCLQSLIVSLIKNNTCNQC